MLTSNSITNLAEALAKAQGEMPAAPMDSTNPFLHNSFASLGSLINTSQPVLLKHGFSVVQMPFMQDQQVGVLTRLLHSSGEWIEDSLALPIEQEKGKSRAQVLGSIITYLRRYAFQSILRMYADEDTDGSQPEKPAPKVSAARVNEAKKDVAAKTAERAETNAEKWKTYFLGEIAKKAWGIWAWQWAIGKGYIKETDNLKMIGSANCPKNVGEHAKAMAEIKAVLDSFPKGISQELDEAFTKAHLDDLGPQEAREAEPAWKSVEFHFGPNKGMTLGQMSHELPKKLFGWFKNYTPEPFHGKIKEADANLRRALDQCGEYMGYNGKKEEPEQAQQTAPAEAVAMEDVPF